MVSLIHTALRSTNENKKAQISDTTLVKVFQFIDSNTFEELKCFLKENSCKNLINTPLDGQFAIHRAVQLNRLEMLKYFLEDASADATKKSSNGETIWHFAIRSKNKAIIQYLLEKIQVLNTINRQKESVLDLVVKQEDFSLLKKLLEKGFKRVNLFEATKNTTIFVELISKISSLHIYAQNDEGQTLLHAACRNDNIGLVKSLLSDGFNVNKVDKKGRAPIHMAIKTANLSLISLLVNSGALLSPVRKLWIIKQQQFAPVIHEALYTEDPAIISYLIAKGADLNVQEHSGLNAFGLAVKLKLSDNILMELVEGGSIPNLVDKTGRSILHSFKPNSTSLLNFLYKRIDETERTKAFIIPDLEKNAQKELNCPICKDIIPESEMIHSLDCKHKYHHDCLEQWFQTSFKCPQCNDPIVKIL